MKTSKGSRQHGLAAVLAALKYMKELLVPLVLLVVTHGFNNGGGGWAFYWRMALGGVLVLGAFGWGFLKWWWFRYKVEDGLLKVEEGVLVKKKQSIPLERIQTVDFSEGLLHRMAGLVRIQVQTAGGTKPEAVFAALSRAEAEWLEQVLRSGRVKAPAAEAAVAADQSLAAGVELPDLQGGGIPAEPPQGLSAGPNREDTGIAGWSGGALFCNEAVTEPERAGEGALGRLPEKNLLIHPLLPADSEASNPSVPEVRSSVMPISKRTAVPDETVFKLPASRLFLAGLTVNNMGVGISLLFAGLSQADDIFPGFGVFEFLAESSGSRALLVLCAAALLIAWVLAVASSVIRYGEFTVTKRGEELLITRGLLERRKVTLPVRRIQAVRISQEVIWRPFRLAAVHVVCAGYGNQQGESTLLFPLMRLEEVEPFLRALCPEYAVDPERASLAGLPRKAAIGYMLPVPLFLAVCTAVTVWFHPYGLWGIAAIPAAAALAWGSYRRAGYVQTGCLLLLRRRWLTETLVIVPGRRIQYFTVSRNLLQQRSGLSSVRVSLAAGLLGAHFGLKGLKAETAMELLVWSRRRKNLQPE